MKFIQWNLREKVLVLSTLSAAIPFVFANVYWYVNAQTTIQQNTKETVALVTQQAADKVDDFLNTKLLGLLSHSQGAALLTGDKELVQEDLLNLLLQDPDVSSLSYADQTGQEVVKVSRTKVYEESELENISGTTEYKIASFKFGKEYISPVIYSDNKSTLVKIAVPVTYPENAQSLRTFSSATTIPRRAEDVIGVLISVIQLDQLSDRLASLHIGKSGYIYLIDHEGKPITYPNKEFIGLFPTNNNTEIVRFLASQKQNGDTVAVDPAESMSLTGDKVMSVHQAVPKTNWAVVAEVPLADISIDTLRIQRQALILSLLPLSVLLVISLVFARKLIAPIQILVKGTQKIGNGNFDVDFSSIQTHDEIQQLAGAYQQMASRLKVEQHSLVAEKTTLSTVLGSIADGVVALDGSFQVLFLNQSAITITGLMPDQVQGRAIDSLIHFRDKDENVTFPSLCSEWVDKNEPHKVSLVTLQNEVKEINLMISSIPPSPGTNMYYLMTFYDVSKEQDLENMKLDFVSMAAHELRTPLTAIKGYLSYLQEDLSDKITEDQLTYLTRVIISSNQLSALIENLLNITKIERGVLKLDIKEFSIVKLVNDALVNLQEVAKQKNITITFDEPKAPLPAIAGDEFRLGQVFTNLVSNGINYTNPNGWIKISIEQGVNALTVHVGDNGQGIPQSAMPHLFTKFYRVGGALEQGSKGTGLGLFISKSIIERHSGKIWVDSVEGKGSTFSFTLPTQSV